MPGLLPNVHIGCCVWLFTQVLGIQNLDYQVFVLLQEIHYWLSYLSSTQPPKKEEKKHLTQTF